MSSENVSNDMAQTKTLRINLVLQGRKVMIEGRNDFVVDLESPVLKIGELYSAVFSEIDEPTNISVTASNDVSTDKDARSVLNNVKAIVNGAVKEINKGLVELAAETERENELENSSSAGTESLTQCATV